jgi:hypothetical protein
MEDDAGSSILDTGWKGFERRFGLYDIQIRSDVVRDYTFSRTDKPF